MGVVITQNMGSMSRLCVSTKCNEEIAVKNEVYDFHLIKKALRTCCFQGFFI